MEDHLRIRVSPEGMAPFEVASQLGGVVDLTVTDEMEALVFIAERLPPRREIDDREAAAAEAHGAIREDSPFVRSAVVEAPGHPFEEIGIRRSGRIADHEESEDPAHVRVLTSARRGRVRDPDPISTETIHNAKRRRGGVVVSSDQDA